MLKNREDVWGVLESVREDAADYFIPLGGFDDSTESKREISNLTTTLYNHLPLVKSIVATCQDKPVYVGYDGRSPGRSGTYSNNIVFLHQDADDEELAFIFAYVHELVHLDQDRRGLLRENAAAPGSQQMIDYLVHNLALEAAAFATEAVCMHYFSFNSRLAKKDPETTQLCFPEYCDAIAGNDHIGFIIEEALDGADVKRFTDMKPAWRALFQSFFEPDSSYLKNYIPRFISVYMHKMHNKEEYTAESHVSWGGVDELRAITTMPGLGPMFTRQSVEVLSRQIVSSVLQEKFMHAIDVVRENVRRDETGHEVVLENSIKVDSRPAP